DADAVFERGAAVLDQIEPPLRSVHDDRAGRVIAGRRYRGTPDRPDVGLTAKEFIAPGGLPARIAPIRIHRGERLRLCGRGEAEQKQGEGSSADESRVH